MLLDKLEALAASGRAIVVVSHDMRLVAERARRVLVLVDGALAFDGSAGAACSRTMRCWHGRIWCRRHSGS